MDTEINNLTAHIERIENAPSRYELPKTIDGLKASLQTRQEETDKV